MINFIFFRAMMTFKLVGVRTKQKTIFFDCGGQENSFDVGGKKNCFCFLLSRCFCGSFCSCVREQEMKNRPTHPHISSFEEKSFLLRFEIISPRTRCNTCNRRHFLLFSKTGVGMEGACVYVGIEMWRRLPPSIFLVPI